MVEIHFLFVNKNLQYENLKIKKLEETEIVIQVERYKFNITLVDNSQNYSSFIVDCSQQSLKLFSYPPIQGCTFCFTKKKTLNGSARLTLNGSHMQASDITYTRKYQIFIILAIWRTASLHHNPLKVSRLTFTSSLKTYTSTQVNKRLV